MNALDAELALDRLEARLAAELPPHIAASAEAYARETAAPAAIDITHREIAAVHAARSFDELRARGTRLLRAIAPIVIDSAPSVIAARTRERSWDHWRALADARDTEARRRFGLSHRALVHQLAGTSTEPRPEPIPPPVVGWMEREGVAITDEHVRAAWSELGGDDLGALSISRCSSAHPRTFVVERGARAIIVVPAHIDTPAARFAVLHELGHALLWLAPITRQLEWPRALDEAAASYVARGMEAAGAPARWSSPIAAAARARRLAIARVLDAIEARCEVENEIDRPPWALWNDPHAQAAYVAAERIADEMPVGLRGSDVASCLAEAARRIDAAT